MRLTGDARLLRRAVEIVQWSVDVLPTVTEEQLEEARLVRGALRRAIEGLEKPTTPTSGSTCGEEGPVPGMPEARCHACGVRPRYEFCADPLCPVK